MRGRSGGFSAFAEGDLSAALEGRRKALRDEVHAADENYLLNVAEDQYAKHMAQKYVTDPLKIDFDGVTVSMREEMIPAEWFDARFNVFPGKSYAKPVFTYHLPFRGEASLLKLTPSTRLMWTTEVFVRDGDVCFDVIGFHGQDPEPVKRAADETIQHLSRQAENVASEVGAYNDMLPNFALETVKSRRQELLARRNVVASLGVPIKKKENLPETYAIPTPQIVRKIAPRPEAHQTGFTPHPTLDADTYAHILSTLHDLGVGFERHPSLYADRGEEALRDQILLYLTPRYEGSTTGETFNKSGKTDILMRYENSNIFVAECLVWDGPKYYLSKIDQLLGYLTWRDSKAAVVVFVRNKDFSSVLASVEDVTPNHPQHVRFVDRRDRAWFNYVLGLPADRNLEVHVAVMLFHLPPDTPS